MKKNRHLTVKGDVLDRGQLKWGALMLPEHVRMLREWEADEPSKHKPRLDEEELGLLQEEIGIAYQRQCMVEMRYWDDGPGAVSGTIASVGLSNQTIEISSGADVVRIAFADLLGVRMID
ncbi:MULTISPECIES: YolD-like family protein [unclassified Planococcus (in: firmicutes)]|uniref:YolD-like family protein n=1 Tax=unclassified Planococcus (in: firmicutes) TaxID=2662419 RepID=UPI000C323F32|nr:MULTISPECIES: YolD-like family protein [unclassified Planococcus (in: firmicutes)]AUD14742.1 YolD-like family protein [Planococcus sp. MB-3u-03]PKG45052.1 YolD-like family protein [Planococcus sp. Urea-trap-24]PKG87395.1 YolD-like family protein [Planococcus sp. Urea-3u-39]PKH42520.1 YolD-like family protein [Planococcus sp. MB-3u-09]